MPLDRMKNKKTLGAIASNENGKNGILTSPGKYATSYSSQRRSNALQKTGNSRAEVFGTDGNISEQSGTSIFDPVLCEIIYRWFCPLNGLVLDPFAGGSVRGIVAAKLGRRYIGIDLSSRQIKANKKQVTNICKKNKPIYYIGDSRNIDKICVNIQADIIFSCPPYVDLEIYSDDPQDISTLNYSEFLKAYQEIIKKSCALLKDNRFACFVVGEVRDKKGIYYQFVPDTIKAFATCGLKFYNEAILITAVGSLPIRVRRQFDTGRKLGKTHQNVLIFVKGDPKKATADIGSVEFGEINEVNDAFPDIEISKIKCDLKQEKTQNGKSKS